MVVGLVFPDLWACIVWGTCLGAEETLCNLRHVEVTHLDHAIFGQEQIGAFDVPVDDFEVMK
jgi:hypothetical protein